MQTSRAVSAELKASRRGTDGGGRFQQNRLLHAIDHATFRATSIEFVSICAESSPSPREMESPGAEFCMRLWNGPQLSRLDS